MTRQDKKKCGCDETVSEKAQKAYHSAKETATEAVDRVKEKSQEVYDSAKEVASKVKHSLSEE